MQKISILLICLVVFAACKKTEIKSITIPGNKALPDPTIEKVKVESFINRVYIELIGRKPNTSEFNSAFSMLENTKFTIENRSTLVNQIQQMQAYRARLYEIARANLLNQLDTTQITQVIGIFSLLAQQPEYISVAATLNYEIIRLKKLQQIPQEIQNNSIDIHEIYRRCINNYFYDQLNMGTENFVVSSFQHFFDRYPTQDELTKAKRMVDGFSSDLFYQFGSSKDDYVAIFMSSDNYYEGQVRDLYKRFLFRQPNVEEMYHQTQLFKQDKNYQKLQQRILSSNEYAGI